MNESRYTIVQCAPGIYAVRDNADNVFEYVANAGGEAGRLECERALALATGKGGLG